MKLLNIAWKKWPCLKQIDQDKLEGLRIIHCVFGFENFTDQYLHVLPIQLHIEKILK